MTVQIRKKLNMAVPDVPPPVVGQVFPNSPAQRAGIEVGDRVLTFDNKVQRDFTKIQLNVALVKEGESVPVEVQRPDGSKRRLEITASRADMDDSGFLALGITATDLRLRAKPGSPLRVLADAIETPSGT